jgi:hypothetical protein
MPSPADLSAPSGVDTVELLEVRISLDFRLPSSEDLFENLFEDQSPTDDMDYILQEAGDFVINSSVDQSPVTSDCAILPEMDAEQNLKLFSLLEASLRVLLYGSLSGDSPGVKIVEKPASLKEIMPSQFNPRYVKVRAFKSNGP